MGTCTHHPQSGSLGEGVCSRCLQKKLNSVWRGESSNPQSTAATAAAAIAKRSNSSKEAVAVLGSIASISNRKPSTSKRAAGASAKGRDASEAGMGFVLDTRYTDGVTSFRKPVLNPSGDVIHSRVSFPGTGATKSQNVGGGVNDLAKRRSKVASLVSRKVVGKSAPLQADAKAVGSLPLVDRIAKETALRVIREVGDDDLSEGDVILQENVQEQGERITCFSPLHWQSKLRSKWGLKAVGNPISGSNRIFPKKSVESVQKLLQVHFSPLGEDSRFVSAGEVDRQRRAVHPASDLKHSPEVKAPSRQSESEGVVIEGMPDRILKPEDMNQRLRTSYNTVLKWLQDLPVPEPPLQDICDGDDPHLSSSFAVKMKNNDLVKVGHLKEIAEEHENLDESSVEELPARNHLRDVSSFGKFLIRAAQRKPKQGLSRVASAR